MIRISQTLTQRGSNISFMAKITEKKREGLIRKFRMNKHIQMKTIFIISIQEITITITTIITIINISIDWFI